MTSEPAEEGTEAAEPALVEPARQQLIGLAAEVLGRLSAEDVPASLRPIARFAPAKRARLGAVAIGAALDADADFRDRVAQTVLDTSPELVTAVREGVPTTAADPIDVAVVTYLVRPDGWPELLAAATRRWRAEQRTGTDELAALRAEVSELRSRARTERARIRQAVAAAGERAEAELAELRHALRERSRELRVAEQEQKTARVQAEQAGAELASAQAAHARELRRLRARLAEAERTAETARREVRTDRDLDTARLWLLVDTLLQAASGVRRELSLPVPSLRPADTFDSATGAEARRQASDPAALDQLLRLPNVHLIIDGYNVTKSGYGDLALAQQRDRLLAGLAPLHAQSGAEITVAFDGGTRPPVQPPAPRGVRVLFSEGEIADDLIRRLVAAEPAGRPVVVVSSDGEVVRDTGRDGAWTVPSTVLLARLG